MGLDLKLSLFLSESVCVLFVSICFSVSILLIYLIVSLCISLSTSVFMLLQNLSFFFLERPHL